MGAGVLDHQARALEQVLRRLRHDDLGVAGDREDTRGGVDREAARVVADELDLARVDADPDRDPHVGAREAVIASPQRTARDALSNRARKPSPVVSISRPR